MTKEEVYREILNYVEGMSVSKDTQAICMHTVCSVQKNKSYMKYNIYNKLKIF